MDTIKNQMFMADGKSIASKEFIEWSKLDGCNIFITGANGLIGSAVIYGLMEYNRINNGNIQAVCYVRNVDKANDLFGEYIEKGWIKLVKGDVLDKINYEGDVDYIIHGASETSSRAFVDSPVETIQTAIYGTDNILKFAKDKGVKGMIYMSSMEVYGTPLDDEPLTEDRMGYLNPLAVRSSYSESKQMVENLCVSYNSEYNVPVKIVRLTQTFGPGVEKNDGRVFAQFARAVVNGNDIELQTKGETKRMFLYTADAASAILTILTKGEPGQAYNAANTETYCSIWEMANAVAKEFGHGKSRAVIKIPDKPNTSYNPVMHVYMDVSRLNLLGWSADVGLMDMYRRMIECM